MRCYVHTVAAILLSAASPGLAAEAAKPPSKLETACSVRDVKLLEIRSGLDLALERAGKAWVESRDGFGFLSMPGCKVEIVLKVALAASDFVNPGGYVLYQRFKSRGAAEGQPEGTFFLSAGAETPIPLEAPKYLKDASEWRPVLSDDAKAVVWLERRSGAADEVEQWLWVRDLATLEDRSIQLVNPEGQLELLSANAGTGLYVMGRSPNEVLVFDESGELRSQPTRPADVTGITSVNFRRFDDGWVAWDDGRTEGRNALQWSTGRGSGTKQVPNVRFDSVAVDPWANLIAFSTSRLGAQKADEGVYILRVEDGSEMFRRALPTKLTKLAFLGSDYLAMSTETGIDVLRLRTRSESTVLDDDD